MAQAKKISELTSAGTLSGLELVVVVQDGETRQGTSEQITASVSQRFDTFEASTSAAFESLYVLTSLNAVSIAAAEAAISGFETRVNSVSAAVETNTQDVVSLAAEVSSLSAQVSTLEVSAVNARLDAVSALTSANAAAISALEILVSTNTLAITSVNAEVSLKAYRSGDYLTNTRYIEFDTSASNGLTTGKLAWNSNDGTLDVGLPGDTVLQVGQETLFYVKNGNASTISNGRLVMATSVVGNSGKIIVDLADGSGFVSPEYFLGIATQDIATGEFGYVTHFGLVRGINATGSPYNETWAEADLLYANVSILGGLTKNPPAYPGFSTPIAIVVNATSNTGSIFVRMKSGEYLQQLHDVDISTKASGDIITWNSTIGAWTNSQAFVSAQADIVALEIRVSAVSAVASTNAAAITSANNVVSALAVRVNAVSASVLELTVTNPVVQQTDIGMQPNEIPLNQYLGSLAFSDVPAFGAPSSAGAAGSPGQLAFDADYLYVCVSVSTWKRVAVSTW